MPRKDVTGQRFGQLVALRPAFSHKHNWHWWFMCDCGEEHRASLANVRKGRVYSCPACSKRTTTSKHISFHGMSKTSIYRSWSGMKQRCTNPKTPHYDKYGGRGIRVCDEWMESFDTFYRDMGDKPEGTSLDRIDNDGDYEPSNCRWATQSVQIKNRRETSLTYNGETHTLKEWAAITGIGYHTIRYRYKKEYPPEKILAPGPPTRGHRSPKDNENKKTGKMD